MSTSDNIVPHDKSYSYCHLKDASKCSNQTLLPREINDKIISLKVSTKKVAVTFLYSTVENS